MSTSKKQADEDLKKWADLADEDRMFFVSCGPCKRMGVYCYATKKQKGRKMAAPCARCKYHGKGPDYCDAQPVDDESGDEASQTGMSEADGLE